MKILIRICQSPQQVFLMDLSDKKLIKEIENLIERQKYSKAIIITLSKGRFLKKIIKRDLKHVHADLILTEEYVTRDLTLPR